MMAAILGGGYVADTLYIWAVPSVQMDDGSCGDGDDTNILCGLTVPYRYLVELLRPAIFSRT